VRSISRQKAQAEGENFYKSCPIGIVGCGQTGVKAQRRQASIGRSRATIFNQSYEVFGNASTSFRKAFCGQSHCRNHHLHVAA
jgi:hypothetical protein